MSEPPVLGRPCAADRARPTTITIPPRPMTDGPAAVAVFVQIFPEAKRRQLKLALDACDA